MSFVPLPSIGHPNADGRVRRVMLVEPQSADGRTVERLGMKLRGAKVTNADGAAVCALVNDDGAAVTQFYTRRARLWRSVTPVVLHGFNASRGTISLGKTEALLRRAFEMAGFTGQMIAGLAFQPAPLWDGTGAAAQIRVPAHLQGYPRYHIEVRFREPVMGPVLAGIGRHYGIGIFAARSGE
jgi:CRISPR-associated protein Csb2